jgi:uncharacterized membrane protein
MSEPGNPGEAIPIERAGKWLLLVRVLLLVALCGAGYLAWVSFQHGPVAGCGEESGCNKVLQSRWAYWLDIPVSVPAVAVYLAFLGATFLLQRSRTPDDQRGSWAALITLSLTVLGAALWFIGLQVFVLKAFCKFCMTAHLCGFTAALVCLTHIPWATEPGTPMWSSGSGKRGVPKTALATLAAFACVAVAILVGGQLMIQKERNVVKVLKPGLPATASTNKTSRPPSFLPVDTALATAPPDTVPNPQRVAPHVLTLYSNRFVLDLEKLPMIGSPDATNIIVSLFDYTCPHCRALHPILVETQRRLGNQLGIVSLPMPISTNCNPHLPARIHSVPNACEFAQLGLAVWRAKPEAFHTFDEWMFASIEPRFPEKARAYAAELVGEEKLKAALADPWVAQQIKTDCDLHLANWNAIDTPIMPQLIIGLTINAGPLNSPQHLAVLLARYLGIPMPPEGAH